MVLPALDLSKPITAAITAAVAASRRFRWLVLLFAAAMAAGCTAYAVGHFRIDTATRNFISPKLPWRQTMIEMDKAFPLRTDQITVVVDGKTPELTQAAAQKLTKKLRSRHTLIQSALQPAGGRFFNQNALLFMPIEEMQRTLEGLLNARPLLSALSSDQSLRGIVNGFSFAAQGARARTGGLDRFEQPLSKLSDTLGDVLAGRPVFLSWQELLTGKPPGPGGLRQIIEVHPVLDRSALQPGEPASEFIRKSAKDLGLTPENGVRVRLTGPVPLADQEYSAVEEGAALHRFGTAMIVAVILWLALRSPRLVLAAGLTVAAGLAATAAAGLAIAGALNLLSLAFGVLFIGIGTDFAIQLSVRYRAERHEENDLNKALVRAASKAGRPLLLATAATAAGFYSFIPTDYVGIAQLGLIAGTGMFIAFLMAITVLPALVAILGSPEERRPVGFKFLAPADDFMARHRYAIVIGTLVIAAAASPLLLKLRFDSNPLDLSPPHAEAVATLRDLATDPATDPNTIDVLVPSLEEARPLAERLRGLPEVARVTTLQSFIPDDQKPKLAAISEVAGSLKRALSAPGRPPPSDNEDVEALRRASQILSAAADGLSGKGADAARRLAGLGQDLAEAPPERREAARKALLPGLETFLDRLRASLNAREVTLRSLPAPLKREWLTPDGRARVNVAPEADTNNTANLIRFSEAVLKIVPNATGQPVIILEAGRTVVKAFIEAAAWALLSISILLILVLRRITDMLLTLVPLLLAGLVTLELTALIGWPLNFANIIALPLLLGLGVAFKIYYVMAWRGGTKNLLASTLTRAVFFSALTTATAFGSLWLSRYPGLSSMGQLLALSLGCALAAAVLFQPALMGPPRVIVPEDGH